MKHLPKKMISRGMTLTEIILVTVILGILVAISVVAYSNFQKSAAKSAVGSALKQITQRVVSMKARNETVNQELVKIAQEFPGIQISYISDGNVVYYTNLSDPQKGLLLLNTCQQLIDEGFGMGVDGSGNPHAYISPNCRNFTSYIKVGSWGSGQINLPIDDASLQAYVTSHGDSGFQATAQIFVDELKNRYASAGGSLPINQLWPHNDASATPSLTDNAHSALDAGQEFCIIATHSKYSDVSYVTSDVVATPVAGTDCSDAQP